ncbi:uncharacterized protein LOC119453286 [Dermacentor silvarum]|uniref:uncharacterized protein LOC119453286 n=1 Tax=Dermacentor silvarum TaxID=543639 RepID=UPI00189C2A6A|nr:uncharacterized protein LOC119453286 [Dermacentor silvarum]
MECRLNLGALLLACFVLHAQASLLDILRRHFGNRDICDKLVKRLNTCVVGMEGFEARYFKNKFSDQGTQDQIMGCVKRRLVEKHTLRICEGSSSVEILAGCIDTSLRDHVSLILRWRVGKFSNKIKVCLAKYKGDDESRMEAILRPLDEGLQKRMHVPIPQDDSSFD